MRNYTSRKTKIGRSEAKSRTHVRLCDKHLFSFSFIHSINLTAFKLNVKWCRVTHAPKSTVSYSGWLNWFLPISMVILPFALSLTCAHTSRFEKTICFNVKCHEIQKASRNIPTETPHVNVVSACKYRCPTDLTAMFVQVNIPHAFTLPVDNMTIRQTNSPLDFWTICLIQSLDEIYWYLPPEWTKAEQVTSRWKFYIAIQMVTIGGDHCAIRCQCHCVLC